ncbi:MAG: hypothetical protein U1E23_14510 [Reyranellaceae bacterium]
MSNAAGIDVVRKGRKPRGLSPRQKASSLFRLWHSVQDIKEDAAEMKDKELQLLIGMIELVLEERVGVRQGGALALVDTSRAH